MFVRETRVEGEVLPILLPSKPLLDQVVELKNLNLDKYCSSCVKQERWVIDVSYSSYCG